MSLFQEDKTNCSCDGVSPEPILPYIGVSTEWIDLEGPSYWNMRLWHVIFIFLSGFSSIGRTSIDNIIYLLSFYLMYILQVFVHVFKVKRSGTLIIRGTCSKLGNLNNTYLENTYL